METIIRTKNLNKTYRTFQRQPGLWNSLKNLVIRHYNYKTAVSGIDLEINKGEFVGFLGPNGAGKTTTLKMLSGILYPTEGQAEVAGYVPWRRQAAFQKQMSIIMGQKNQLWFDLPAADSFNLLTDIYDLDPGQAAGTVKELASLLGVTEYLNVQVRRLSLGERMKMELIAALIHRPKVLFLDEPTIGLDVVSQKSIRDFLKRYNREEKVTILLTSHYMEDIVALCQRVIIIDQGSIKYDSSLSDLLAKYQTERTIRLNFDRPVQRSALAKLGQLSEFKDEEAVLIVPADKSLEIVKKLLEETPIKDFSFQSAEADEVIRRLLVSGIK